LFESAPRHTHTFATPPTASMPAEFARASAYYSQERIARELKEAERNAVVRFNFNSI